MSRLCLILRDVSRYNCSIAPVFALVCSRGGERVGEGARGRVSE